MQSHLPLFSGCIQGMAIFTHHIILFLTLIMVKSFKMNWTFCFDQTGRFGDQRRR
jgi:hypothetical protein